MDSPHFVDHCGMLLSILKALSRYTMDKQLHLSNMIKSIIEECLSLLLMSILIGTMLLVTIYEQLCQSTMMQSITILLSLYY